MDQFFRELDPYDLDGGIAFRRPRQGEPKRCNGQRQGKGRSGLQVVLHVVRPFHSTYPLAIPAITKAQIANRFHLFSKVFGGRRSPTVDATTAPQNAYPTRKAPNKTPKSITDESLASR